MFHNTTEVFDFNGTLNIQNPYGNLPAEEYPYLPVRFLHLPFRQFSFIINLLLLLLSSMVFWD